MQISSKISYSVYFSAFLIEVALVFFEFISMEQFLILLFGVVGVIDAFYYPDKLVKESILISNKHRVVATLTTIVVFLSCTLFVFYPTLEGVFAAGIVLFSISVGFTLIEWRIKAQLYDRLKNHSDSRL
jgi:hypothetical protein